MEYKKALSKCMQLCSRKEYCETDIREKLQGWELENTEIEKVIKSLIDEKFINEKRFTRAFVNDKFKFNHWGKIKIAYYLKQKNIHHDSITQALDSIDENEYMQILNQEVQKKVKKVKAASLFERNAKVVNYMASKGFETNLVFDVVKALE